MNLQDGNQNHNNPEEKVKIWKLQSGADEIWKDKNDLVILVTAFKTKVDAIITGDKHFDSVEVRKLIEIMDTNQALRED